MREGPPPGNFLSHIVVDKLYGEFTYTIGPLDESADPRILMLYGDNGTGKSSILRLLRSLLSPSSASGHRTKLGQTPFLKFEAHFRNGLVISASRESEPDITGSYLLSISGGGEGTGAKTHIKVDPVGEAILSNWPRHDQVAYRKFMDLLQKVSSEVKLLDDKRTFTKSELHRGNRGHQRQADGTWRPNQETGDDPVATIVSEVVESIRVEALMRQRRGSHDSQGIYKNLISKIASGGPSEGYELDALIERLASMEVLSAQLSEVGLTAPLSHGDLISQLQSVGPERRETLAELVSAYIETTDAWFGALNQLRGLIDKMVAHLNYFMHPKVVTFSVSEGLTIFSDEKRLDVSALSSGERHLVMLLSQAVIRRNAGGLLIIDEPELSLNIKWQRELVNALLDCLGGGASQVILATHSIEIAAKYRKNVERLWRTGKATDEANN